MISEVPWFFIFLRQNTCAESICVHAKSLQSCPTLCNPMDCSLPGYLVHGFLQARTLEWVAIPSSRRSSGPRNCTHISCVSSIAGRFFTESPRQVASHSSILGVSLVAQMIKNLPEMQKTQIQSLGWEDPLEKGMATTPKENGGIN